MSVNKVILIGRIGQDLEPKTTSGGKRYYRFSLATDQKTKDKDAKPDWHQLVAWEGIGDTIAQYLKKGDEVYVEGRLNYWDTPDGKRMADVIVENFTFIAGKKRTEGAPKKEEPKDDELPY